MAGKNIHKCCRLCRKHAQDDTSHQKIIEHKLMGPELHCMYHSADCILIPFSGVKGDRGEKGDPGNDGIGMPGKDGMKGEKG
jgi:hypothetical protein